MSDPILHAVFLAHLAATLFMTGVIWFVQVVHYPLFAQVETADFSAGAVSTLGSMHHLPEHDRLLLGREANWTVGDVEPPENRGDPDAAPLETAWQASGNLAEAARNQIDVLSRMSVRFGAASVN